jgi:hypothetical protein
LKETTSAKTSAILTRPPEAFFGFIPLPELIFSNKTFPLSKKNSPVHTQQLQSMSPHNSYSTIGSCIMAPTFRSSVCNPLKKSTGMGQQYVL